MKRASLLTGAILGFLSSLVVMALSYLGNLVFKLPFLPFDLFEGMSRVLPGAVVDGAIRTMVTIITTFHLGPTASTAKLAEQLQGLGLIVGTGIVFGLVLVWIGRRSQIWITQGGLLGGFILWIGITFAEAILPQTSASLLIGLVWLLVLLVGWGWVLGKLIAAYQLESRPVMPAASDQPIPMLAAPEKPTRRNFLIMLGSGVASAVVLGIGIENNRQQSQAAVTIPETGAAESTTSPVPVINLPYGPQYTSGPAASPSADVLAKRFDPAPGTREEITKQSDFYRIDINLFPPQVDAAAWRLAIGGLVSKPANLTLSEIVSRPSVTQALTMSCISNFVGGDLISSAYWTGVRLKDILAEVGVQSNANAVSIAASDGFYESLPMTEAMDDRTLLVYAMNGEALTPDHGYPLRIYIPNHYGMKQPKWITGITLTTEVTPGYWVDRGWSETAIPQTQSAIDTKSVNKSSINSNGVVSLGGVAWAGERGISKVEIQINSDPWVEAELRNPTVSPLTWVQWRYDWKPTSGSYQVKVRATDGTGVVQVAVNNGPGPEGATGYDVADLQI